MSQMGFEELARTETDLGTVSLRRRWDAVLDEEVVEVKLDDEYLMSSAFTEAEEQLAHLALAEVTGEEIDVVVGGLGLGYTAMAVLEDPRVRSLIVVEALESVADWHEEGLLADAAGLSADDRVRIVVADFFALAADRSGFDPQTPGRTFDAVLVDIDHSPRHLLRDEHASFYRSEGLRSLAHHLRPGGVFGLWSDAPPDEDVIAVLDDVFAASEAHVIAFPNPYSGGESTNTVYVARTPDRPV